MLYLPAAAEDWSSVTALEAAGAAGLVALEALVALSILILEAVLETAQ